MVVSLFLVVSVCIAAVVAGGVPGVVRGLGGHFDKYRLVFVESTTREKGYGIVLYPYSWRRDLLRTNATAGNARAC